MVCVIRFPRIPELYFPKVIKNVSHHRIHKAASVGKINESCCRRRRHRCCSKGKCCVASTTVVILAAFVALNVVGGYFLNKVCVYGETIQNLTPEVNYEC